jgi:hypothetical protein
MKGDSLRISTFRDIRPRRVTNRPFRGNLQERLGKDSAATTASLV